MDILSSSQPPASPKNQVGVIVACPNCRAQNTLANSLQERPSPLEDGLIETVIVCPDCGHEKHIYFMSKELHAKQTETTMKIRVLSRRATQENLNKAIELKENYKNLFDAEQFKYKAIVENGDGRTA